MAACLEPALDVGESSLEERIEPHPPLVRDVQAQSDHAAGDVVREVTDDASYSNYRLACESGKEYQSTAGVSGERSDGSERGARRSSDHRRAAKVRSVPSNP